jgi:hypothetical protein
MNESLEILMLRKQLLLARSSLCRLRIRYEVNAVRDSLSWGRASLMVADVLPICSAAVGLASPGTGGARLARSLALAVRMLLLARLWTTVIRR